MRLRIVVSEPEDLSADVREMLEEIGDIETGPYTRRQLLGAVAAADILLVRMKHLIDAEVLNEAPNLRAVVSATTGHSHLEESEIMRRGIRLISLRGETKFLNTITATAELTWCLVLNLARKFNETQNQVLSGKWDRDSVRGSQINKKTLGIVGFGRLGQQVADYGKSFGMRINACDTKWQNFPNWVKSCSLHEVCQTSDVISIHVPGDESNWGLIGTREFGLMKADALFVNTARGEVVDEDALLRALKDRRIGAAALDVLNNEQSVIENGLEKNKLWQYAKENKNLLLTPHVGGSTHESLPQAERFVVKKLISFLGKSQ